jgi:hypothetical protein
MRQFVVFLFCFCATAVIARADYIELSRPALLKAEPERDADVVAQLTPPLKLPLLNDPQRNGYYHVKNVDTDEDGWVYRTLGRRYAGNPPFTSPRSSPPDSTPSPDAFSVPHDHNFGHPTKTENCKAKNGLPDPDCTPGDIIKENTKALICSADFRTGTVRNTVTTPAQKNKTYPMYAIAHPANNTGRAQVCEIDHLVPLQLGGADTIANLWPECSPGYSNWQGPSFREKDGFENYLWFHVCINEDTSLEDAQLEISTNWRKYWELAGKPECRNRQDCD